MTTISETILRFRSFHGLYGSEHCDSNLPWMEYPVTQIDRCPSHLHVCNFLDQTHEYWLHDNKIRHASLVAGGMLLDQATFLPC
jgi:hypothetical protein